MSFAKLIGNDRNKQILQRLLGSGRISATLIFAGPDGVGKRQFALTLAKAANCQKASGNSFATDSCDECAVCRRIDENGYGDVTVIQPDGQYIKIAQARELAEEVYYRPREGRQRFFIIDEADRLRDEAANCLLKTLEEPPSTSTLVLLTSRPNSLLQTIRSRAQRISFAPLPLAEMEKYQAEKYPHPAADTALLARVSEGRIGQATAFDLSVYRQERRTLMELLELMAKGQDRFRLLKAAEYIGKKERDEFEKELDLLISILRDVFLLSGGASQDQIVNVDVADRLQQLAAKIGLSRVALWSEKISEVRKGLRVNINRQIAMEAALLGLAEAR